MNLRERALAAFDQREYLSDKKDRIRLQEELQKLFGISVPEPQCNEVEFEGYFFWFGWESGLDREKSLIVSDEAKDSKDGTTWKVKSLADLGEAIQVFESPVEQE